MVLLASITLAGCTTDQSSPEASAEASAGSTADTLPTPIVIITPDSRQDCTTWLEKSQESVEDPDRARVRCADKTATVAGTFRDRYTNVYDPAVAGDIEKITVVGGRGSGMGSLWRRDVSDPARARGVVNGVQPTEPGEAETAEPVPSPTFTS